MFGLTTVRILLLFGTTFILAAAAVSVSTVDKFLLKEDKLRSPVRIKEKIVFISTLDGRLIAIDPLTGNEKWTLAEEPVLRVPVAVQTGFTFLPDPQDGTLYGLSEGTLKKFPFTIPQLVQASPCKSTDGILYAGSKKDVWFAIDPETGMKIETLSQDAADRFCPASNDHAVFIGRTEYQLTMFDGSNRQKKWNGTFTDYSSHLLPEDTSYSFQHFSSSSDGLVLTVDSSTGDILWEKNFRSPTVAMYMLEGDGLHRLPLTVIGKETLQSLIEASRQNESSMPTVREVLFQSPSSGQTAETEKTLYQSFYVGETSSGLYAVPCLVDGKTVTITKKYLGPPLLEGPKPLAEPSQNPNPPPKRRQITVDVNMATVTHKTVDGEFLLLGYHDISEPLRSDLIILNPPRFAPQYPSLPYVKSRTKTTPSGSSNIIYVAPQEQTNHTVSVLVIGELWAHRQLYLAVSIVAISGIVTLIVLRQKLGRSPGPSLKRNISMQTSKGRPFFGFSLNSKPPEECDQQIGKIFYKTAEILGRGCEGTVVYRGHFDGRSVAVKRVVSDFVNLVDREVGLLRESDSHPNVIRYYCMESDSQFRYIALELCWATLADYVDSETLRKECPLSALTILEQATTGLHHLHSLYMVHRDVKPQNVMLSTRNSKGIIHNLHDTCCSQTYAVDVFSLGCVFYYVMTYGCHPFGDNLRRQANILTGEYSLKELIGENSNELGAALVEKMICIEPQKRPSTSWILKHPFFWSKSKQLAFFQDVSDRVEKVESDSWVLKCLERKGKSVTKGDWKQHICPALQADLRKFRTYRGSSVRDLLRAMRNKKHHYRELPEEVRDSLGSIPDGFVTYFTSRFPRLLLHSHEAMRCVQNESPFAPYYSSDEINNIISINTNQE